MYRKAPDMLTLLILLNSAYPCLMASKEGIIVIQGFKDLEG